MDEPPAPYEPPRPYIVTVGRLERQKAHDVLIEAFTRSTQCRQLDLLILGEGSARAGTENRVRESGLRGRVHMPGFVDAPWAYVHRARAFV